MVRGCKPLLKLSKLTENTGLVLPLTMHLNVLRTDICSCLADSAAHGDGAIQFES